MSSHYKTLAIIVTAVSLLTLTGCIIEPDQYNASGTGGNQGNTQQQRGDRNAAEYDRG